MAPDPVWSKVIAQTLQISAPDLHRPAAIADPDYEFCQGLRSTFKYEQAFRLEVYILVILIPLAFWLGNSPLEYCLLIGSWLFVMIVELLNSAVEAAIDRIGMEKHELSGRAKDIGSAAVMVSVFLALGIWVATLI